MRIKVIDTLTDRQRTFSRIHCQTLLQFSSWDSSHRKRSSKSIGCRRLECFVFFFWNTFPRRSSRSSPYKYLGFFVQKIDKQYWNWVNSGLIRLAEDAKLFLREERYLERNGDFMNQSVCPIGCMQFWWERSFLDLWACRQATSMVRNQKVSVSE